MFVADDLVAVDTYPGPGPVDPLHGWLPVRQENTPGQIARLRRIESPAAQARRIHHAR